MAGRQLPRGPINATGRFAANADFTLTLQAVWRLCAVLRRSDENRVGEVALLFDDLSRPTLSRYFHDPSSLRSNTRTEIEVRPACVRGRYAEFLRP